jgi:hypothetical protein
MSPSEEVRLPPAITHLVCEGQRWAVAADLLERDGVAERDDNPAAAAFRRELTQRPPGDTPTLPRAGWIEIDRNDTTVRYAMTRDPMQLLHATVEHRQGWELTGFGDCWLRPQLPEGTGPAAFRVAPGSDLSAETTEIEVLVTELACSSGRDASGRVLLPVFVSGAETVTIMFAVATREGAQECPSNPETPVTVELPAPLGGRTLLDGSDVPPRDATTCPDMAVCP